VLFSSIATITILVGANEIVGLETLLEDEELLDRVRKGFEEL